MPATPALMDSARLARLLEAGRSLVAELALDPVLKGLLAAARELTGAKYAAIGILDSERRELERFVTAGIDPATHRAIGDLPRGRGILGLLIEDARPLRLRDIGEHPRSYGFPPAHPPMTTFLGVPIRVRGEAWGNLYLTEKTGGQEFDEADEQAATVLADWAAVAVENARLYEQVRDRRDDLERAVRGLEATSAIARAIGGETDLDRVLELIVKRGRALVEARSLVVLLTEGDELVVASAAGQVDAAARGRRLPLAGSLAAEVLRTGRPERIADVPLRAGVPDDQLGVTGAETALLVPLVFRGRALGVMAAFDRMSDDGRFGDEEERLMLAFAASAATAVATAQTVERDRLRHSLRASEQERRRWARELHDETLQALGGLRVLLSGGLRQGSDETLRTAVEQAVDQLGLETESLRSLIAELRPAALDELGLRPALEGLAERVGARNGLDARLAYELPDGMFRLDPELETVVYRIVQEALTNAAKHAGATQVEIAVRPAPGGLEVEVADEGAGFDTEAEHAGFGLLGMRERAELLGGTVDVRSGPNGTTVRARLPVPGAAVKA
jgi:signal transduction histidine kinase